MTTVLDVQTRVSDLYGHPFDQIQEQLRLQIEKVKERQESELINNKEYGLLANTAKSMRIKTRAGSPTPGDLDELIAKVWKEPSTPEDVDATHRRLAANPDGTRQARTLRPTMRAIAAASG